MAGVGRNVRDELSRRLIADTAFGKYVPSIRRLPGFPRKFVQSSALGDPEVMEHQTDAPAVSGVPRLPITSWATKWSMR